MDDKKCCINFVDYGTKRAKIAKIVSAGQKWAQLEKEHFHYDWNYETNIWIASEKGGDFSSRKRILIFNFLTKLKTVKTG